METDYIVLDEPTAMLDYVSALSLYQLLSSLHQQGKTIIIIEHDTDFLLTYAHQILVLKQGFLVMQGEAKGIFFQRKKLQEAGIKIPKKISYEQN